jgi:hypothetical protein
VTIYPRGCEGLDEVFSHREMMLLSFQYNLYVNFIGWLKLHQLNLSEYVDYLAL